MNMLKTAFALRFRCGRPVYCNKDQQFLHTRQHYNKAQMTTQLQRSTDRSAGCQCLVRTPPRAEIPKVEEHWNSPLSRLELMQMQLAGYLGGGGPLALRSSDWLYGEQWAATMMESGFEDELQ